jgi:hypothetical protein
MSNLTITIDADLLRAARIRALQQGTSVNEVCRRAIAAFAGEGDAAQAEAQARAFWTNAERMKLSPRPGPLPRRDELYAELLAEPSPGTTSAGCARAGRRG